MSAVDHLDNPTVNKAADVFGKSVAEVKSLASNLKGGALARVFKAVVEFPLQEQYPKFRSDAEHQLFTLTLACLQAKNVMLGAIMASRNEAQAAIDDAAAAVAADSAELSEAEKIMRASPEELEQMRKEKGIETKTEGEQ